MKTEQAVREIRRLMANDGRLSVSGAAKKAAEVGGWSEGEARRAARVVEALAYLNSDRRRSHRTAVELAGRDCRWTRCEMQETIADLNAW